MARVLIAVFGSTGDVHPFLAVGRELARRGHDVRCLANPYFERKVRGAGLGFVPLGTSEEFQDALRDRRLMHRTRAARFLVGELVRGCLPDMVEFVRDHRRPGDTVVVASATAVGAVVGADAYGVPTAFVHLAPASMPSDADPPTLHPLPRWVPRAVGPAVWRIADHLVDDWIGDAVNAVRAEHALPPVRRVLTRYLFRRPELRVGLFPEWFAPKAPDWPEPTELLGFTFQDSELGRHDADDEPLDGDVAAFLAGDATTRPIVVSMGTANMHAGQVYRAAVAAAERIGRRVLVLTHFPESLPEPLPDHAFHASYAPFSRVLPSAAALVHHGGAGTTAQALRAGVPQLIVPRAYDQHDNGERVARLGCGITLPQRSVGASRMASSLEELLGAAGVAHACRLIAARFADDPHGERVVRRFGDLIEDLLPHPLEAASAPRRTVEQAP